MVVVVTRRCNCPFSVSLVLKLQKRLTHLILVCQLVFNAGYGRPMCDKTTKERMNSQGEQIFNLCQGIVYPKQDLKSEIYKWMSRTVQKNFVGYMTIPYISYIHMLLKNRELGIMVHLEVQVHTSNPIIFTTKVTFAANWCQWLIGRKSLIQHFSSCWLHAKYNLNYEIKLSSQEVAPLHCTSKHGYIETVCRFNVHSDF